MHAALEKRATHRHADWARPAGLGPWQAGGLFAVIILILILAVDVPVSRAMWSADALVIEVFRFFYQSGNSKWYLVPLAILIPCCLAARLSHHDRIAARLYGWTGSGFLFVFAAIAVSGILVNVIKILTGRARPELLETANLYGFFPIGLEGDFHSFPSGHTNTLFALMISLALFWPRARTGLLLLAAFLSAGRVVMNKHFVSDVVAGAALAWVTTLWLRDVFARHHVVFEFDRHGRVHLQAPGRLLRRRLRGWLIGLA